MTTLTTNERLQIIVSAFETLVNNINPLIVQTNAYNQHIAYSGIYNKNFYNITIIESNVEPLKGIQIEMSHNTKEALKFVGFFKNIDATIPVTYHIITYEQITV